MTMRWQQNPMPASSLLLSQRQKILDNYLAGIAVTPAPIQQRTHEMREEVVSSAGAYDLVTRG